MALKKNQIVWCLALGLVVAAHAELTKTQRDEIGEVIGQYLDDHPEAIHRSLENYLKKQAADQKEQYSQDMRMKLTQQKDALLHAQSAMRVGSAVAPHTAVLFMDPYCQYCHKMFDEVQTFVKKNPQYSFLIRVVPLLGEEGQIVIRALQAAHYFGGFELFIDKVKNTQKNFTEADLVQIAEDMGLNKTAFQKQMYAPDTNKILEHNRAISENISLRAAPMLVYDGRFFEGYLSQNELNDWINNKLKD